MESPSFLGTDGGGLETTAQQLASHRGQGHGAWYHIRGGYTDTYINFKTKRVFKYCDRYYMDGEPSHESGAGTGTGMTPQMIHYSTVCDLVFSKMLGQLHGFPPIHQYLILKSKIRIEMDYLGKTLHDAAQSYSKYTRLQLAPKLLAYLTHVCYNLKYNGIQHTDLKPGNVCIDGNDEFHLIDFNCMSTMGVGAGRWHPSIGTWQYVAPEILMSGKPNDSSMVWSIGMVMAQWLLGHYPISNERMERYVGTVPTSQMQWKRLMTDIRRKYPDFLQMEQRHLTELNDWWGRIKPLLRWNPYRRWNLERLLQSLYPMKIHVRNMVATPLPVPTNVPEYVREKLLRVGYRFLKEIQMEFVIVNTVAMFDMCYTTVVSQTFQPELLFLCAWTIQGYLTNQFLFDSDTIVLAVHQYFHITCDVILANVYTVLEACHYNAWQKEWYVYLGGGGGANETVIRWDVVVGVLMNCKTPYSPVDIARMYVAAVNARI